MCLKPEDNLDDDLRLKFPMQISSIKEVVIMWYFAC